MKSTTRVMTMLTAAILLAVPAFATTDDEGPNTLAFSTYLGGEDWEAIQSVAVSPVDGTIWVTGHTESFLFPVTPDAAQLARGGIDTGQEGRDAFVTQYASNGDLLYSTFLGGSLMDVGNSIGIDGTGNVYVAGESHSRNFPVTPGAFDAEGENARDGFLAKFSPAGVLLWATHFGGDAGESGWSGTDYVAAMAVTPTGLVYITGITYSDAFPVSDGAYRTTFEVSGGGTGGYPRPYIIAFSPDGDHLWGTFYGGSHNHWVSDIAVGPDGGVFVTGGTSSIDFPTTPGAYQTEKTMMEAAPGFHPEVPHRQSGTFDAFLAKFTDDLGDLVFGTYYGGGTPYITPNGGLRMHPTDDATSVAIDAQGRATIAGRAGAVDLPTSVGAPQPSHGVTSNHPNHYLTDDGFIATFSSDGSELLYGTYLGGEGSERVRDVAIDPRGRIVAGGSSDSWTLPTTEDAYQRQNDWQRRSEATQEETCDDNPVIDAIEGTNIIDGLEEDCRFVVFTAVTRGDDAFVHIHDPDAAPGEHLIYGSFIGGNQNFEGVMSIALDAEGAPVLAGDAGSRVGTPTKNSDRPIALGVRDAWLARFTYDEPSAWPCTLELERHCLNP